MHHESARRPPTRRLLLVEDDRRLAGMLAGLLTSEGYDVTLAGDGQEGLHLGLTRDFEVLVLDRGLPAIEGLSLLGRLRAAGQQAPALVLSALATSRDRVEGLDAGAEDYLAKPFDVEELLARLTALLRRAARAGGTLAVPGGQLCPVERLVRLADGRSVHLSGRETALLGVLASSPTSVFSRHDLLATVFEGASEESVVESYVHYLRRKLGRHAVVTVRGYGYRLGRE